MKHQKNQIQTNQTRKDHNSKWRWSSDWSAAVLALLAFALVMADLLPFFGSGRSQATDQGPLPVSLVLAADWSESAELRALQEVLGNFRSLYPYISVDLRSTDVRGGPGDSWFDNAELIIRTGPPAEDGKPFRGSPVAWTGSLWVLAARTDLLHRIAEQVPAELAALRAGQITPEQFRLVLQTAKTTGLSPLTLGNSHRWPFLLWLQHWTAATSGPQAATTIPAVPTDWTGADPEATDPWRRLRIAFNELMAWKSAGWFDPTVWSDGWAKGLQPLTNGKALFALVSAEHLSAMAPATRSQLEYLRFPARPEDEAWTIGSASYLGLGFGPAIETPAGLEAARLLMRYLSSPGVTSRLAALTGKPFFAWDSATGRSPLVLAAWLDAALTPDYEAMARELDPGRL